jgi:protease-4
MPSSRRGPVIVLILILVAAMVSAAAMLLVAWVFGGSAPPAVPASAALQLRLTGPLGEIDPLDVLGQFIERPPTLRATVDAIRKAKADTRVKTLVLRPQGAAGLWGQVQEIRAAVEDFRKTGKPVVAFLEYGGAQDYYLASASDRIVLMPAGQLDLSGLAWYELFLRGALDKLGVYPDLLHIGQYKTASNTFTERGFTAAHREMSRDLNRSWYDQLVGAIAEGRKKPADDVRRAIDAGPHTAESAHRLGLVDALGYDDELDDNPPVQGTRPFEAKDYAEVSVRTGERIPGARIAVLYAVGTIASGRSSFDQPGGLVTGSDTFVEWVRKVRIDPAVRAIVVRIDSPGGSAIASEVVWRELMIARDVKPLVVSMGDVAASGGYYIALPAHVIVAQPGTITGSIGVVTGKFVLQGTFDKLGVGVDAVSEGRKAEIYSPFRRFSTEERAVVEEQMQATYDLFVKRVAEARRQPATKVDAIAQGRVWTGRQARQLELVDELGGLTTAIQVAKQRARLDLTKDVELVIYPPRRSLYEILADPLGSSFGAGLGVLGARAGPAAPVWPDALSAAALADRAAAVLRLFRRSEPLVLMPNILWR